MAKASSKKGRRYSQRSSGRTRPSGISNRAEDPAAAYRLQPKKPATVLSLSSLPGPQAALFAQRPEHTLTSFEKMELLEKGISKKDLEGFKKAASLDYDRLARVLNVARATLLSRKGREKFSADLSDKIIDLADVYSYGFEVFGQRDRFNQWLSVPNRALGGRSPFDILHNSFGRTEVRDLIGRIDYGVYS